MIGIILSAGTSRRLGQETSDCPKCLIDVNGKEMLGRQLEQMKHLNFTKVYIAVGFYKDKIIHYCQSKYPDMDVTFIDNTQWYETNNAKSLELVLTNLKEQDDIVIFNADVVCYEGLVKELVNSLECENLLAYQRKKELPDEDMKLKIDDKNNVVAIGKTLENAIGEFTGIAKFSAPTIPMLLKYLKMCKNNDWFERALQYFIENEEIMYLCGLDVSHYPCIEIDFPEDLEEARDRFPYNDPVWEQGRRHESLKQGKRNINDAIQLMVDFRNVLDKYGIRYWLNWGLLLGCVREGQPMLHDTDLDICIDKKNEKSLWEEVVPEMRKLRCFVPDRKLHCDNDCFIIRDGEGIECNTVEKINDKYIYSPERCNLYCPAYHIDQLQWLDVKGYRFSIPSDIDKYLTGWYGEWRFPSNTKPKSF